MNLNTDTSDVPKHSEVIGGGMTTMTPSYFNLNTDTSDIPKHSNW